MVAVPEPHLTVAIRERLRPGDIGALTRLHGELYAREYGYGVAFEAYCADGLAEIVHRYDHTRDRLWLAEDARELVGSLFLTHRDDDAAQLRFFLVAPSHRGQGLGKALMQRYMAALAELGYARAYLWTTNDLAAAASLYTRHGFRLTEERSSTRFGKPLVEQRFDWQLKGSE